MFVAKFIFEFKSKINITFAINYHGLNKKCQHRRVMWILRESFSPNLLLYWVHVIRIFGKTSNYLIVQY